MIAVVDYGMGNLRSVSKALERVGADTEVTADARTIERADAVVLPGVGAFARCMENLSQSGLEGPVREAAATKPFLGICVGMQILFEESEEFGRVAGLGILPGRVRRFDGAGGTLKVPHMGWNTIEKRGEPPLLAAVEEGARVYFVHSYYVEAGDPEIVAATTTYGSVVCSAAWRKNLFAVQFHPEKSQAVGLAILADFCRLAGAVGRPPA